MTVVTGEDVPSAPQSVTVDVVNNTALLVQWQVRVRVGIGETTEYLELCVYVYSALSGVDSGVRCAITDHEGPAQ